MKPLYDTKHHTDLQQTLIYRWPYSHQPFSIFSSFDETHESVDVSNVPRTFMYVVKLTVASVKVFFDMTGTNDHDESE